MGQLADIVQTMREGAREQADAIRQAAAARAQGQANTGQLWGSTLASLGQTVAQIPGQMQQQQANAQRLQLGQNELDAQSAAKSAQARANQVVAGLPRNDDGTFDTGTLLKSLAAQNIPLPDQEKLAASVDGVNKVIASFNAQKKDHAAELADTILQQHTPGQPVTADSVHLGLAAAQAAGIASAKDVDQLTQALATGANPELVLKSIRQQGAKFAAEKPVVVAEGGSLVDSSGKALFTSPKGPKNEAELAADAANPNSPTRQQSAAALQALQAPAMTNAERAAAALRETERHNRADEGAATARINKEAGDVTKLTPEAIDIAALNYLKSGQMPTLGMGDKTTRQSIINRAAQIGKNPAEVERISRIADIAGNRAQYKSDADSLTNVTKTLDTLSAFENTAGKNLDQFLALADKVPDSGVPWLNTPVRVLNDKMVGSGNQAAFNAARDVALREIARVTNDPKLSGVLSDAARKEVSGLSASNATFAQIKAVAKVLKQDMANVHSSMQEQREAIQGRIGGVAPAASAGAPKATGRFNPATGKVEPVQ